MPHHLRAACSSIRQSESASSVVTKRRWQFSIASLMKAMFWLALFMASLRWAISDVGSHCVVIPGILWMMTPLWWIFPKLVPAIIIVLPIVCLTAIVWMVERMIHHARRPWTGWLFLGYAAAMIICLFSDSELAAAHLIDLLTLTCFGMFAEVVFSNTADAHGPTAFLSIVALACTLLTTSLLMTLFNAGCC